MDNWDSFITDFKLDHKRIGKQHTVGIERNNCRLRHRLRRAVRKTFCLSEKLDNHFQVFDLVFLYVNIEANIRHNQIMAILTALIPGFFVPRDILLMK